MREERGAAKMQIHLTATQAKSIYKVSYDQIRRAIDSGALSVAGTRKSTRGPSAKHGAPVYRATDIERLARSLGKNLDPVSEDQADHFWLVRHFDIGSRWVSS